MKKYFIITFGCQTNKSDSERIASVLEKMAYNPASKINEADLIVINMCSVRQSAVDRVYGFSPKLKKLKNPAFKTILTGCILRKDQKKFKNFFDFVLPIKTLEFWPVILKEKKYSFYLNQRSPSFIKKFDLGYLKVSPKYRKNFSVFIPISTGCNNFCAYCVVPFTRGPLICRPHEDILKEIENSIKKGAKEVWLLGQNVNDYRSPTDPLIDFPKLLEMTNNIPGNFWLSFISSNPKDFSKELIQKMAECKKINEYLNLPIQSGDNEILKKMNRLYTIEKYKDLVKKVRQKIPNIALSTDVIVGFPGETKEQFQNTAKLFKEMKFDMAYIAEYSPRPGTKAYEMNDDVPRKEKIKRREILTKVLIKTALEKNKKYIGKEVEVLANKKENRFLYGKTRTHKTVKVTIPDTRYKIQDTNLVGKVAKVKIVDALPWGLKGTLETLNFKG
ncbi:MAG: tRNA (N6-isopentenyl adenosine(37)-C2)-methylthiotransferase MiaB [Candidatus Nealsonbacteria bacterium]